MCALFWAQVISWRAQWPEHRDTFLLEFGPWEHVDQTVNIGAVTGHHRAICSTCSLTDPRVAMFQISKWRHLRVLLTELINMRPKPKKGRTLLIALFITECPINEKFRSVDLNPSMNQGYLKAHVLAILPPHKLAHCIKNWNLWHRGFSVTGNNLDVNFLRHV